MIYAAPSYAYDGLQYKLNHAIATLCVFDPFDLSLMDAEATTGVGDIMKSNTIQPAVQYSRGLCALCTISMRCSAAGLISQHHNAQCRYGSASRLWCSIYMHKVCFTGNMLKCSVGCSVGSSWSGGCYWVDGK